MSASKEYIDAHNRQLEQEITINRLNNQAFENLISSQTPKRPKDELEYIIDEEGNKKLKDINLERNIAETYVKEIANIDPKIILNYLEDNNELSTFNKYFTVFKQIIGSNKIASLGEFINLFTKYKDTILSDISRTGLFPVEDLKTSIDSLIPTDVKKVPGDLLSKSAEQIENDFRMALMKEFKRAPVNGDVIQAIGTVKDKLVNYTLLDTDKPFITIKAGTKSYTDATAVNIKIKYILKVNHKDFNINPNFIRWSPVEKIEREAIIKKARKEVKKPPPMPLSPGESSAESDEFVRRIKEIDRATSSGSGLGKRYKQMTGRGIKKRSVL